MCRVTVAGFFATAIVAFIVDQGSKAMVRLALPLNESVPLIPNVFHLTHTRNPGAAFGLFSNATLPLIVVALVTSGLLIWLGRRGFDQRRPAIATGLMLGGAVGNLVDRLWLGAVTDFLDLRVWPIFNFADVALTVGAALFLWWSLSLEIKPPQSPLKGEEPNASYQSHEPR